jgi:hypothetical protein
MGLKMSLKMLIGLPLLIIGIALLVGAAIGWAHRSQFLSVAIEAPGKIVGEESYTITRPKKRGAPGVSDGFRNRQSSSSPIVEFRTREGQTVRFKSKLGSSSLDEDVMVLYSPTDPSRAEIKNYFAQTGWLLLLAGLGMAFLIGGAAATKLMSTI